MGAQESIVLNEKECGKMNGKYMSDFKRTCKNDLEFKEYSKSSICYD